MISRAIINAMKKILVLNKTPTSSHSDVIKIYDRRRTFSGMPEDKKYE